MHHPGLRSAALAATIALGLSACAVPHNNVLVFGTDTSFGVNVDIAPDPSSPVGIAIGYKRKEAVWMPLVVNEQDCGSDSVPGSDNTNPKCKTKTALSGDDPAKVLLNSKFVGSAKGISPEKGGSGEELDTYSVFASFGGNAKGGKEGGAVAVAQFFATGIAAQRLGANPGATRLVSAATGSAAMVQDAKDRADAEKSAKEKTEQLLEISGLSKEELAKKVSEANELGERITQRKAITLQYIFESSDTLDDDAKIRWNTVQAEMTRIHGEMIDAKKKIYQDVTPLSLKAKFDAASARNDVKDLLEEEDELLDLMFVAVTNLLNTKL